MALADADAVLRPVTAIISFARVIGSQPSMMIKSTRAHCCGNGLIFRRVVASQGLLVIVEFDDNILILQRALFDLEPGRRPRTPGSL